MKMEHIGGGRELAENVGVHTSYLLRTIYFPEKKSSGKEVFDNLSARWREPGLDCSSECCHFEPINEDCVRLRGFLEGSA